VNNTGLRTVATGLVALAVAAGALAAAPAALAATATSCTNGITTTSSPNVVTLGVTCSGFVDNGAPYVFNIATLSQLVLPRLDPNGPFAYVYYNVVESCTAYANTSIGLQATGCTRTH
jgi:hypothetical protein